MEPGTVILEPLLDALRTQRRVVEYLLFKLITLNLLLVNDERRFVETATGEVDRVVERLREAETHREAALAEVARAWRRSPGELTLARLGEIAPEPAGGELRGLQREFRVVTTEIERVRDENQRLAGTGLDAIHALLDTMIGGDPTVAYDRGGRTRRRPVSPIRLDRAL